jgi:cell division protein FtsQ
MGGVYNITMRKIKFLLITVLSSVILALLAISPLFNIKSFKVSGNVNGSEEIIIQSSGIDYNSNGFMSMEYNFLSFLQLRFKNAENEIMNRCRWVKNAEVKFILPSTVSVKIEERVPEAFISYFGTNLLIDRDCFVIESLRDRESYNLLYIRGVSIMDYELGQRLKTENDEMIKKAFEVIDAVRYSDNISEFKLEHLIDYIDVSDINNVYLFIDSRVLVNIGNMANMEYRMELLKKIYANNIKQNEKGLLDFTAGKYPVFKSEDGKESM